MVDISKLHLLRSLSISLISVLVTKRIQHGTDTIQAIERFQIGDQVD